MRVRGEFTTVDELRQMSSRPRRDGTPCASRDVALRASRAATSRPRRAHERVEAVAVEVVKQAGRELGGGRERA